MSRQNGFQLKSGYVVLAIPDSGLFVKDGQIVTGHETPMEFDELILFSRRHDAEILAVSQCERWSDGDKRGHKWNFQVIPVLVSERL